jgi:hypothetical protein
MRQEQRRPVEDHAQVSISIVNPALCAVYPG